MPLADPADAAYLAHELRVHQAELETQNEELRQAQLALAAARDRYRDLFDFAPVGYLTLDAAGCIVELNLTGARLLGAERARLLGRPFARLVETADRRLWHAHHTALAASPQRGRIELTLRRPDRSTFAAQLDVLTPQASQAPGQAETLWLALSDISERRAAETDRRIATHLVQAREDERQRVAHTLHEDLGQRLSALRMNCPPDAAAQLDAAIAVVRRMVNELRPTMLDELGLQATLQWLARDAGRRLGIDVSMHPLAQELRLGEHTSIGVYRVMEALLADLARHAPRGSVAIRVRQETAQVVLEVEVHASGWPLDAEPPPSAPPPSLGLAVLDPLHLLGAQVQQHLQPDGARVVVLIIPLAPSTPAGQARA